MFKPSQIRITPARPQLDFFSEDLLHAFQTVCQRDPWLDLDCFEMQRVSGDGGTWEMVSHVTVAEVWEGEGVTCNGLWGCVTCNSFWDLEDEGTRCHM